MYICSNAQVVVFFFNKDCLLLRVQLWFKGNNLAPTMFIREHCVNVYISYYVHFLLWTPSSYVCNCRSVHCMPIWLGLIKACKQLLELQRIGWRARDHNRITKMWIFSEWMQTCESLGRGWLINTILHLLSRRTCMPVHFKHCFYVGYECRQLSWSCVLEIT